jgi:transposase-like protein
VRRGQSIAPVQHPWTAQAKVRLVDEVAAGKATREEICERHNISAEEFECWSQAYAVGGINALKLKGIQQRRASC